MALDVEEVVGWVQVVDGTGCEGVFEDIGEGGFPVGFGFVIAVAFDGQEGIVELLQGEVAGKAGKEVFAYAAAGAGLQQFQGRVLCSLVFGYVCFFPPGI